MYDARLCVCLTLPVSKVVMMIFLVGSVDLWHSILEGWRFGQ